MLLRCRDYWGIGTLVTVLAVLPAVLSDFNEHLVINIMAYGIAVLGLDFIVGRAGLLCFAQAVFVALGSYVSVVLMIRYHFNWIEGAVCAVAVAGVIGALVAFPAARLTGLSFAFITFTIGSVSDALLNGNLLQGWVNGSTGLFTPPATIAGSNVASDQTLYILAVICVVLTGLLYVNLTRSRSGRALETMRESTLVAQALGVPVNRYRIGAFAFGAMLAGVGGVLLAQSTRYVSPGSYNLDASITLVAMLILGGRRSPVGPFLGAAFFVLLPQELNGVQSDSPTVFSAILLGTLIFAPSGIVGTVTSLPGRVRLTIARRRRARLGVRSDSTDAPTESTG